MSAPTIRGPVMHGWYEVFDNEEVHYVTRKQVAHLGGLAMGMLAVTIAGLALGFEALLPWPLVLLILAGVWFGTLVWTVHRLRQLRRVVWCVKISDRRVIGYDYARRRTILDWTRIERVELTESGLVIVGPAPTSLEIPHLFPDFAILSHRILQHAEFYGTPLYLHGQPWQDLNVYTLFPFLGEPAGDSTPPQ